MSETTTQAEQHVDILNRADVVADQQIDEMFISYTNTITLPKHLINDFEEVSAAPNPGQDLAKTVAKKSHMEQYPETSPEITVKDVDEKTVGGSEVLKTTTETTEKVRYTIEILA